MEKIRLQKIIADSGLASRRKAEEWISGGKVKVNGHPAKLGDKANPRTDHITVSGKRLNPPDGKRYIMLNKPRGTVSTMSDEKGRKCVSALVEGAGTRVYPVGRLDKDSEGLLLMTNDGAFTNMITHPAKHIAKFYRVTVRPGLNDEQMALFRSGMRIKGEKPDEPDYFTAPAEITELSRNTVVDEDGRSKGERVVVEVVLREGRNRQIRRMFGQMGIEVVRLKRVAVGSVKLGMLPPGKWRELTPEEVQTLMRAAGADVRKGGKRRAGNTPRQ